MPRKVTYPLQLLIPFSIYPLSILITYPILSRGATVARRALFRNPEVRTETSPDYK